MSNIERALVFLAVVYGVLDLNGVGIGTRVAVLFGATMMTLIAGAAIEAAR